MNDSNGGTDVARSSASETLLIARPMPKQMRPFRSLAAPAIRGRRRPRQVLLIAALTAAALTLAVILLIWYMRRWSVGAAVERGLTLMQTAQSAAEIDDAFAAWEGETDRRWRGREAAVLDNIFAKHDPTDPRVRAFISSIAGADFGDRRADWDRWYAAWTRMREDKPPALKAEETVRLDRKWEAPVGLTAWHTTMLPIDGKIYVASLGSDVTNADDPSDGLVRVDGATGDATLIFVPPDRGPRDILGLAAGSEGIFVACRNGHVYLVSPDGELRWKTFVGGPIAAIPLAVDVNRDAVRDVVVMTQQDKTIALNGANGRTLWSAAAPSGTRRLDGRGTLVCASLAVGDLLSATGDELLITTLAGSARVLSLTDGALRWKAEIGTGCYAGGVIPDAETSPGRPALIADGVGGIWSLLHAGRSIDALQTCALGSPATLAVVAAPRTLISGTGGAPWLLTCSAGTAGGVGGSVFALDGEAVRWRNTPGGVIWGTPAIADLNADRRSEIIIATMEGDADRLTRGALNILSSEGHFLRRIQLPAPVESSPIVADVDGDGRLEVLVADRAGVLHCFATKGFGPVEWGVYGGDGGNARNARRAYAWGQTPHGHQWRTHP